MARWDWLRRTRAILNSDAREAADRYAVAYFRFIGRHRASTYLLTIALSAGVFVIVWRALSLTVAIVVGGLSVIYGIAMAVVAAVRLRRLRGRT